MARHDVTIIVPERQLGKSDAKFRVKADGKVIGTLTVSNGSVVWFPRGTSYGCKMGWAKFDKVMKEEALREERR
ncbi:hypothetical protein FJ251_14840 [bacterium]|nr:hypothetical protein [bacterium]